MSIIVVDVEADDPIPGDFSMISFGAVLVDDKLDKSFYGQLKPISVDWRPDSLKVSGFTREQTLKFEDTKLVMLDFKEWLANNSQGRPLFYSDNNGFDFQFINWYFIHFLDDNPFGHSSANFSNRIGIGGVLAAT